MAAGKNGSHAADGKQVAETLAALPSMSKADLRAEWRRIFRSHPPQHIRGDLLVLELAWKVQEKAYGGLTAAEKRRLVRIADDLKPGFPR